MRNHSILLLLTAVAALALGPQAVAVTTQTTTQFEGRNFLWLEAEDFSTLGVDDEGDGWRVVSKEAPITSTQGLDILPADSNVHGTALLDDVGGGQHADTAIYELQFRKAGTYQFYSRHTMFDQNGNSSFSNEDSIFISPAFNLNSRSDWVGFEGLNFDDQDPDAEIPDAGFALDPIGFKTDTGDSDNDGWYAIRDWRIKSAGEILGTGSQDPSLQNGVFSWYNRPALVSSGAGGGFDSDYGFKTEYIVTEAMVGEVVTFEVGTREHYGVFDGFLFIEDDDVNLLDVFTQAEVDPLMDIVGDPDCCDPDLNMDGFVDGLDLGILLGAWDPAVAAAMGITGGAAVPEPTTAVLLLASLSGLLVARRR